MASAQPEALMRRFEVHAAYEDRRRGHAVDGQSFEAAALAFIEAWHPAVDADGDVSVIVTDCEDGRRQCFRIDVETGESAPCA